MADKEIDALTAATTPTGAEIAHIVQSGNSRETTVAVIGHQFRGAVVKMTSDDTAINATTAPALSFDSAVIDTDSFWSAGSPTRLTIPAGVGVTHVELVGAINVSSTTADTHFGVQITHYNSSNVEQQSFMMGNVEGGAVLRRGQCVTGVVAVSDGDYFVLRPSEESDTSVTIEGDTAIWTKLSLKVIGMQPV